ncbi:MAG: CoA-binding protein [Perlucidibaca sp.]
MTETVAVLGASPKPERYSNRAIHMLREYGHRVIPVNPIQREIAGLPAVPSLADISEPVDTVTIYVSPPHLEPLLEGLLALRPGRVIFNPGAEHPRAAARLEAAGIRTEEACTLVLLRSRQF